MSVKDASSSRVGRGKSAQVSTSTPQVKGTIVPHPSYPPQSPSTKFQVLGQIPKPYSSALMSQPKPYDPFEDQTQLNQTQLPNPVLPRTEYVPSYEVNQFYIEHDMKPKTDPIKLAAQFFPPGWHFIPFAPYKSLSFYKDILIQTESIVIKPIYDKNDNTKVLFHSLYIKKIIPNWGNHPSDLQPLTNPNNPLLSANDSYFSYFDYMEAWQKIFLYQNPSFSHSWFIQFDHKFKSQIPFWFIIWWSRFSPLSNIFLDLLLAQVNHFSNKSLFNPKNEGIPILLRFVSKYKIPWILKWQYNLPSSSQPPVVTRIFFVKWWNKFDINRIVKQVQTEFPILPVKQVPASTSRTTKIKEEKSSPSSSVDISNINKCSVSELKLMADAINQRVAELHQEIDDEESSVSSHSSNSSKDPYGSISLQDAQDPFA